ncbi:MAG: hypothetical protein RIR00_364 [Pseudomonadota bacterium]
MSAPQRVVDARGLEPPEPFVRTVDALDELADGETLQLLIYREPHPLFRMLRQNGYTYRSSLWDDGTYEILIRKA